MKREKQYTSTSNKLLGHLDRLQSIKKDNKWYPINLQLAPTEACNLNCEFCSVKDRGNAELNFNDIVDSLIKFFKLGLKSIEITGGGDPTLYPQINELIEYCYKIGLKVGFITNGVALIDKVQRENLNRLEWLRISLNGIDYGIDPQIPKIKGTLGFSYVWNKKSDEDKLKHIYKLAEKHNVEYVRIVPDCLNIEEQYKLRDEVNELVAKNNFSDKIFIQTKEYTIHPKCYIGGLKPFLYTDGYIYQCSAVALYNRKFDEKWRICHMNDITDVWPNNYLFPNNSMCEKGKCFYCDHNQLLDELQQGVKHHGFI